MICVIALVVFGVLGIFSAKYRDYFKEALSCVARRATLRPCNTAFDVKMKAKITAKLMKISPPVAGVTHRHFEAISWFFMITLFISMGYTAYGLYNLAVFGTCDPAHPENCFFNPGGGKNTTCDVSNFTITGSFIEFVGEGCHFCVEMEPTVRQVEKELNFSFEKLEVWYNETNQAVYLSHADAFARDCGSPKDKIITPTFFSAKTGKALCGEVSAEKLKSFIIENR